MTGQRHFYCGHQINLMKYIGIWPLETESRLAHGLMRAFRYFEMTILFMCSLGLLGATLFTSNLKQMSSTVDILTLTASALYKISFISWHIERVCCIVESMDCKFIPEIRINDGERFDVKYESKRCTLYSVMFVLSGAVTMLFYALLPVLEGEKFEQIKYENGTNIYRKLKTYPLQFWMPFKSDSNFVYGTVYFIQGFGLISSATVYLVNDSFFFMVIYQIALQMRALSLIFKNFGKRNPDFQKKITGFNSTTRDNSIDEGKVSLKDKRVNLEDCNVRSLINSIENSDAFISWELKRCIHFHAYLLSIIIEIEALYRTVILADVIHAVISLSFALFDTGTSDSIYEGVIKYMFLLICILHQFLNSYYGEMFIQAQGQIGEAIYSSNWEDRNENYRKYMVMILLRSQKRTILNGGKLYKLGRPSFVLFLKSIFSYYMVLRQASEKSNKI